MPSQYEVPVTVLVEGLNDPKAPVIAPGETCVISPQQTALWTPKQWEIMHVEFEDNPGNLINQSAAITLTQTSKTGLVTHNQQS
jgi:hypothetical protein